MLEYWDLLNGGIFFLLGADAHVLGGTFGLDYYLNISYMGLNLYIGWPMHKVVPFVNWLIVCLLVDTFANELYQHTGQSIYTGHPSFKLLGKIVPHSYRRVLGSADSDTISWAGKGMYWAWHLFPRRRWMQLKLA